MCLYCHIKALSSCIIQYFSMILLPWLKPCYIKQIYPFYHLRLLLFLFAPCILGKVNQNQWSCYLSFPISILKLTALRRPVGASDFMNYSAPFCLTPQSTVITPYRMAHQSWVEILRHLGLKQTGLYHCCRYHNVIHCGEWRSGRQSQFTVHGCLWFTNVP